MRRVLTPSDLNAIQQQGVRLDADEGLDSPQPVPRTAAAVAVADGYLSAVAKLVPTEIIGTFLTVDALIRSAPTETSSNYVSTTAYFVITGILFALTPVYILRVTRVAGAPLAIGQAVIATLSFAVWVFAVGGPFIRPDFTLFHYNPLLAAILLPVYTLVVPLFVIKR